MDDRTYRLRLTIASLLVLLLLIPAVVFGNVIFSILDNGQRFWYLLLLVLVLLVPMAIEWVVAFRRPRNHHSDEAGEVEGPQPHSARHGMPYSGR